jgi:hypothetical protein
VPRHVQGSTCAYQLDSKSCTVSKNKVSEDTGSNEQSSRSLVERAVRMRSQLMRWLRGGGGIILHREVEEDRRDLPLLRGGDRTIGKYQIL